MSRQLRITSFLPFHQTAICPIVEASQGRTAVGRSSRSDKSPRPRFAWKEVCIVERFDTLLRSLTAVASRRVVLTALAGGVFAAHPLASGYEVAGARKRGKRRNRRKRRANQNQLQSSPPPAPITRVDAICVGAGNSGLGSNNANARVAQTFTARASGQLVSAELPVFKPADSAGDYVLRLAPVDGVGVPTNDVLAETVVANADVPANRSKVTFTFGQPASVVLGTLYALVLTRPGGDFLQWAGDTGIACAGQSFLSLDQTAPFESLNDDLDLVFKTFVSS
jgi:hypothetical protein